MAQIKSFEEACLLKGLNPETVIPDFSFYPEKFRKHLIAAAKLFIITDVLNDGWEGDWNNGSEPKYQQWFDMETTADNPEGFSLLYVNFCYQSSTVPSRLCFKTRVIAEYAYTHFRDIIKDYFTY